MSIFDTYLTEHFTWEEVVKSEIACRLGINNTPPDILVPVIQLTAADMEIVRAVLDRPIEINSWYRCLKLNRLLKSKDTSQHMKGEAVDFVAPKVGSPITVCKKIIEHRDLINFDQLILEHTWIHISFQSDPARTPRNQVLSLLDNGTYGLGLTDKKGCPL